MNKSVELLSPAGSLDHMNAAFAYGADAVYAGQPRYSLRVRNNEFDINNLKIGIGSAHNQNKQFFIASNIIAHNNKVDQYLIDIEPIIALKPDALIMADPGLIMFVREKWPDQPIHLSVQANVVNYASVKFWQKIGVSRIILSRELSLDEIAQIRDFCPDIELEVFVHGALCIAYSGRCLLSGYFNHRDSNQGSCTNACRWNYKIHNAQEKITGDVVLENQPNKIKPALLEVEGKKGEYMPIEEDEFGTYILNSKDLRAAEHIHQLIKIGIDCLKIEGRTKSIYYVSRTAQIYRQIIDDALNNKAFDKKYLSQLENLSSRGYTDGFYKRHHSYEYQNYFFGVSKSEKQQVVGEVIGLNREKKILQVEVKNKFLTHDWLEIMAPNPMGNFDFKLNNMFDKQGNEINNAKGSGHIVWLKLSSDKANKIKQLKHYFVLKENENNKKSNQGPIFIMRYLKQKLAVKTKYHY